MTPSTTFSTATKNSTLSIEWLIKETFPRANNGCNIEENFVGLCALSSEKQIRLSGARPVVSGE